MNRRGFTLTELLMTLSVLAIMGVAMTRILINDSRFVSRQDAMMTARQGARAALNTMLAELSLVADTVVTATRDSLEVRVPVAFGLTCRASAGADRIVTFLPVDSIAWASLDTTGMLWRQRNGGYTRINFDQIQITTTGGDSTRCKQDSVRMQAGGKLVKVKGIKYGANGLNDSIQVAMLYSRVLYRFAPSVDLPGRVALWRKNWVGTDEELVAPFDTSARFAYLMGGPKSATLTLRTSSVTTTASLDSIRGVELRLYAASQQAAQGTSKPQVFPLRTRVRFVNRN